MSAAVLHILRQMQRDPRLAWLIGPGSQTYDLLTEEGAEIFGGTPEEYRQRLESLLQYEPWPTTLEVEIDPQAILLQRHVRSPVNWFGSDNAYRSAHYYMARHHGDVCAPYWRGYETRRSAQGFEKWHSAPRHYVPDDFGTLVEVRL